MNEHEKRMQFALKKRKKRVLDSIESEYTKLFTDFNANSSNLENYTKNWSNSNDQQIYYQNLRQRKNALLQNINQYKDSYIEMYGEDRFNSIVKGTKQLGRRVKNIQREVDTIGENYRKFANADEYNAYFSVFGDSGYGNGDKKSELRKYIWNRTGIMPIEPQYRKKEVPVIGQVIGPTSKKGNSTNKVDDIIAEGAKRRNDLGINMSEDEKTRNDKIISDSEARKLQKKIKNKTITQYEVNQLYDYYAWYLSSDKELKDIINSSTSELTDPLTGNPYKEERRQKAWSLYGSRLLSRVSEDVLSDVESKFENGKTNKQQIISIFVKNDFEQDDAELLYDYINGNYTKGTKLAELTEKHPVAMSLASTMFNVGSGLPATAEIATELLDKTTDSERYNNRLDNGTYDNKRAKAFEYTNAATEIRSQVSQKIIESCETETGGKVATMLYGAGMSILDNVTSRALGGGSEALSLGLMGSTAFSNTTAETLKNGGTITEAAVKGVVAAVIETATEKISWNSMQKFLKSGKSGFVNFMVTATKEAIPEGMEEGISYIANQTFESLYDSLEAASNGNFSTSYMPEYDLDELLQNVVSGIISGYAMSSGATYAQSVNTKITGNIYLEQGKENIIIETAKNAGIKTSVAETAVEKFYNYTKSEYADTKEGNKKYFKLLNEAGRSVGSLNNTLQEKLQGKELQEYNYQLNNTSEITTEEKYSFEENKNTNDFIKRFLNLKKTSQSAQVNDGVDGSSAESVQSSVSKEGLNTDSGFVENVGDVDTAEQSAQVYDDSSDGSAINDGEVVNNVIRNNYKLAKVSEVAKSETAKEDLSNHVDDVQYTNVYNKYVNVEEVNSSLNRDGDVQSDGSSSAQGYSLEERAEEFNRIYDYGVEEDIPPHEIKSSIFTAEQIREIYAAGVVDDNARLGHNLDYEAIVKEYEVEAKKVDSYKKKYKQTVSSKVDKDENKNYNKNRGGVNNEESSDSELLEGRTISTVSRSKNDLRKQSTNSQKMAEYVERYSGTVRQSSEIIAGESGFLGVEEKLSNSKRKSGLQRRLVLGNVRDLSRVKLKKTDTAGRLLPKYVLDNFKNTVFKNADGTILSLYHWTNAVFKTFGKGDIGFHLGTLDSSQKIALKKREEHPEIKTSIFKETYVNITNPILIFDDFMQWNALPFVELLRRNNYITDKELDYLCDGNMINLAGKSYGSKEVERIIDFLEEKGYDGVIYENAFEGDYSVIAFHPEQIYTVAENGIDITKADSKESAFSNGENVRKAMPKSSSKKNLSALNGYSEHQKENWKNSKSIVVYENEKQLRKFVDDALEDKNTNKKMYFGIVPDKISDFVLKETGVDIKNFNVSLKGYEVKKILKNSHGNEKQESLQGQRAITFDDIKMIPEIVSNPDEVMLDNKLYNGRPVLKFIKTINGKTTIVTYVSSKHKDLTIQTMYSGKNKKGNLATATDALHNSNPLSLTSETTAGTVTSNTIIHENNKSVNNSISNEGKNNSEKVQKAIKHKSTKEEWTAENRNADSEIEEVPAISEIINTISKEFNIPISKGKYKGRALGIYKTKAQTARTRVTNALPTVLHEALGHHLDNKYHFTDSAKNSDELVNKIKELYPGFLEQYSEKERPYEAFAEFLREYATDKTRAKVNFPNYFVEFEKTLKSVDNDDFEKLQKIANMTNAYMASTRNERTKSAVITREEAKRRRRKSETLHTWFNKLRARLQDEAISLKTLGNAYEQYYSAKEADMRVYSTITGDYMTAMDGDYAYKTDDKGRFLLDETGNKILQKSMANILSALPEGKADSDFTDYLICKHAIEWVNEDKRVFADDTLNDVEYLKQEVEKYEKKYPMFKQVSEELYEYQNELLKQWLVVGGLMTYEDVQELKETYPCYIPFQRDVGDIKNIGSKAKGSLSNQQSGIKRAKGSGLDILNPIESIMLNTEKYIKSAERNMVMREIADFVRKNEGYGYLLEEVEPDRSPNSISAFPVKAQVMEVLKEHQINDDTFFSIDEALNETLGANLTEWIIKDNQGRDIVYVSESGEKTFFQVHDQELLIALNGFNKPQINGFIKFMSGASRVMKATTTGLNVFWSLRSNIFRDFDSAYKYSKEKNFAVFAKDYVISMWSAVKKSEEYKQYQAAGGGYSAIISNPKSLSSIMTELYNADESKIKKFFNNKMKLIEAIEGISDVIEAGPRFAEYQRVFKETGNKRKAVLAADEITVNFKRKGSYSNTIESLFPYFNASVQGVSKIVTTLSDAETRNPFIVKSMVSAVISVALIFAWNGLFDDEDEYEKLSAYKRNNFYNFYIGNGKFISVPKSKDTAFLNSLFENIVYELTTDNHDFKENFKNFSSYVFDTFLPSGVPNPVEIDSLFSIPEQILSDTTLFGSVAEAMSNQNYMGSPIVSAQYQELEPWAQYDENTTAIAKMLGKLFNFSPMKIDHIITSNLGMVGDVLKDLTAKKKSFTLGFDTLVSDSAYSNDIVNKFYDDFEKAEKAKNTSVKHNPETAGKDYAAYSQYSMFNSIAAIYNSYADSDAKNARDFKALRRDFLNDFNLNIAGNVDERLIELYNSTGDSEIFSSKNFNDEVSIDGKKYKISLDNVIKFFDDYNSKITELYEPVLSDDSLTVKQKVEQLKSIKYTVYDNLSEFYAAQTNVFESEFVEHKDSNLMTSTELLRALSVIKPAFADTDGNGYVSDAEKNTALTKAGISSNIRILLKSMDII